MSLLWIEGFDEFGSTTVTGSGVLSRKYTVSNAGTAALLTGRFGVGYALQLCNSTWGNNIKKSFSTTDATFTVGIACKWIPSEPSEWAFLTLLDGATTALSLNLMPDGRIKLKAGSTNVAISTFTIAYNVFYFFEIQIVCSTASNYTYEVRMGGHTLFSGSDTHKAGAHAYCDGIFLNGFNFKATYIVDDLYVTNGATGFLGNVRVETIFPSGDTGTVQWTPSANAAHYTLTSENPVDDDTTYVSDSTSGNIDLYDYPSISTLNTISGALCCIDGRDSSNVSSTVQIQCVSGATTSNSANLTLISVFYMTQTVMFENDPNTSSAWTVTDFNAAQFGVMIP